MLTEINLYNIEHCLGEILLPDNIDLSQLNWIEPVGLATVSLAKKLKHCEIIEPERENVNNYLDIMRVESSSEHTYQGNTYVPLINLNRGRSDRIAKSITEKIINYPVFLNDAELKKDLSEYLQYMILELLNNIIDHSTSRITPVANAQVYPSFNKCQIAIVDTGVGFFETLKNNYPSLKNDTEALSVAIKKEITGARQTVYGSTTRNVGYGLFFISEIIKFTNGYLKIISNDGMLIIKNGEIKTALLISPGWDQ